MEVTHTRYENTATTYAPKKTPKVDHAVILAAGNGTRFRAKGTELPKVLLDVGGLRLLERSVLTLHSAGIRHFKIVTGAYRKQIISVLKQSTKLKGVDIEYVECTDYELGNGRSLAAGAADIEDSFLLTMADHIFSVETVKRFINKALQHPDQASLACDPNIEGVYDIEDATKILSGDGNIQEIGKEIPAYDLIDTGLFYFPAGMGALIRRKADEGANSVSNIITQLIEEQGVGAISIEQAVWQDVDYPGMRKEAERRLLKSLVKPTDGWVSKKLNRHISTRISLYLSKWGVSPNAVTTFVFFLTLLGAYFAASGQWMWIALGGLIFQIASILDGCDGEIARLTFRSSRFGAWYDTLTDNIRYVIFFAALGYSAYRTGGSDIYLYAIPLFLILASYIIVRMAMFTWNKKEHLSNLVVTKQVDEVGAKSTSFWEKLVVLFRGIDKQDVSAFIAFIFCLIGLHTLMFWLVFIGAIFVSITITRAFNKTEMQSKKKYSLKAPDPFLYYLVGVGILCLLIYNMDIQVIAQSATTIGGMIFLVFACAIPWIFANTLSIANLTKHKIPFIDLLYIEITGDAYNAIIPLAGLGGEPYKIKQIGNWLELDEASNAIIHNRLIHSLTGILFTATTVSIMLVVAPLPEKIVLPLSIAAGVFFLMALAMSLVTLSTAPTKLSAFVLKKFNFTEKAATEPLTFFRFIISVFFKMLGRAFNLLELLAIFYILGLTPDFASVITVSAFISLSGVIFFIIPQGLGVSEASVSTAFALLGLGAPLGLIFGLIRRSRVIFWALLGVAVHLTVLLIRKISSRQIGKVMSE